MQFEQYRLCLNYRSIYLVYYDIANCHSAIIGLCIIHILFLTYRYNTRTETMA